MDKYNVHSHKRHQHKFKFYVFCDDASRTKTENGVHIQPTEKNNVELRMDVHIKNKTSPN